MGTNNNTDNNNNMKLQRILGFTTNSRNSFVSQSNTGNIVYIAGCIVVLFDPETRVQQYLISESKQTITTLAISDDGNYLATADCGQKVTIRIWNLFGHTTSLASPVDGDMNSSVKSNNQIQQQPAIEASFSGHNIEVSCMSFSANNEILVSVGSQQDLTLNIWDWRRKLKLATNKLTTKVRSITFSSDSSYFVTAGEAHLKYWYIRLLSNEPSTSTGEGSRQVEGGQYEVNSINEASSISISCRSATLGSNFKEGSFCDVKCSRRPSKGKGDKNPDTCDGDDDDDDDDDATGDKTFCITKQGLLCELNEKRLLHKWVDLRTSSANCLAVGNNLIVIGCANGVVRCFSTNELRFLKNLPRPHQIGTDIANKKQTNNQSGLANYSSIIGVGLDETTNTISCIHNDRSIYVWNLEDEFRVISKKYSALYHSSCIWGIDVYPHSSSHSQHNNRHTSQQQQQYASLLPQGSFVTCSSDDTLRIWRTSTTIDGGGGGLDEETGAQTVIYSDNVYSDELIKIIFTDSAYKFLCDLDCVENLDGGGQENTKSTIHTNYDSNEGLRCLKLSPDGKHLSVGSRSGTIRVFDFAQDRELKSIAAHDAEVLCLEYSDPTKFDGYYYLASSSRDKLIHLFDVSREYKFLQTIDDHSSSITALRFVNNRTDDCLQLISCGTDQKIVFRNGHPVDHTQGAGQKEAGQQEEKQLNFVTERLVEGKTTFYDMEVDSESSCLMTACQDRMIRLFNVAQVKYQSGFKGSNSDEGTIIKLALDPSCTFLAASCTDRSVSIYDYQRGESVATISHGLSDLVTDMKFSLDGRHLIACSGNGCIFIWSSPAEVANASSCLTTDHQHQSVPTANRAMADWRSPYSLAKKSTQVSEHQQMTTNNNEYQVQNISSSKTINNNEAAGDDDGDDDDDQRTLRGDDSVASPSSLIQSKFHNEILDDDGQLMSQRYARSQRSTTSSRRLARESANGANGSMGNMAKYFQSRENLDKISSRQRYIHDSLFNSNNSNASSVGHRSSRNNASLSGRFVGQEENSRKMLQDNHHHHHSNETPTTSRAATSAQFASRAKSLSRLSSSIVGQQDGQRFSSKGMRRRANSSGDELSSANDDEDVDYHEQSARNYGTNQKFATLNASGHQNKITTRHKSSNSHYGTLGSINPTTKTATKTSSTFELSPRSSIVAAGVDEQAMVALGQQQQQPAYGETRLDLTKLDPNRVHISRELCQQVVEELRVISKFATRLHRRLHSGGSKNLANYVSRGVQNSLDILSIVPPRALTQQQFRSQVDLSIGSGGGGGSCRQSAGINGGQSSSTSSSAAAAAAAEVKYMNQLHASGAQTIGRREVIRPQNVAPAVTPAIRRRSSIGSGSSSMAANVIGSPASEAIESTTTVADRARMMPSQIGNSNGSSNRDSNSSSKRQSSLADHQGQVEDNHSSTGHGSKDFVRSSPHTVAAAAAAPEMLATTATTSAKVFEAKQQISNSSPNSNNNNNAQLNIDQVLEAYSDRLFKMVQQRMEWSVAVDNNAAASSSSSPLPSSSSPSLLSRELANNKQTTTTTNGNSNTKQR